MPSAMAIKRSAFNHQARNGAHDVAANIAGSTAALGRVT
jgi:hypothetical protein